MSFTLQFPVSTPISTIVLKNPELGDVNRYDFRTIINRSRSGELNVLKPIDRENQHTFNYTFVALTRAIRDLLIVFLNLSAGNLILITDHNNKIFEALITISQPTSTTIRDNCTYNIVLDILVPQPEISPS